MRDTITSCDIATMIARLERCSYRAVIPLEEWMGPKNYQAFLKGEFPPMAKKKAPKKPPAPKDAHFGEVCCTRLVLCYPETDTKLVMSIGADGQLRQQPITPEPPVTPEPTA